MYTVDLQITQDIMTRTMDVLVDRTLFKIDGVPTSLADLGYVDVGLDDVRTPALCWLSA